MLRLRIGVRFAIPTNIPGNIMLWKCAHCLRSYEGDIVDKKS
jgi:hypothetical protein